MKIIDKKMMSPKLFDDKWLKKPSKKELYDLVEEQRKEIERLNNNWNELEQWIEKERDKWEKYHPNCFVYYQSILDEMKELKKHKGEDK